MNNSISNDYTITTASFEIILLVLGAFLLGAILCYLLRLLGLCCRKKKASPNINTARDTLQNSQAWPSHTTETRATPDTTTPLVNADSAPSTGPNSLIEGDRTTYGADINSLLRNDNNGSTAINVERSMSTGSFENRARESLASLQETNTSTPIDYTRDMPMPGADQVDDLKKLEGIGPRIEALLHESGIKSYARLATMDRDHLKSLLEKGGSEFQTNEPKSWPYQAELAAKGNWSRLKEYQEFLLDSRQ
uniref:LSU ribosomal protein L21p n=1 Tax=uncultured Thiotrichaceae bacterium TaxID=298394 RepID=A0A6S6S5C1_9GAMM|nr:MAG: Unknown protein [uncultured Thiotrichaceae bacterium]